MLPDGWEDWKTCADDNLYICVGLDPEKANEYTEKDIIDAYRERYEWFQKRSSTKNSPRWEGKFDLAMHNIQTAHSILTNIEKRREYDERLKKEDHEKKINTLINVSILPALEDKILTPEEEQNIMAAGKRLGLSKIECKDIIDDTLKKLGAKRDTPGEATITNALELFRDSVYLAIEDGWLKPKEKRHLLTVTTEKLGVSEEDAKAIIKECLKEKGAKEGTPPKSDLPEELQGKNYYEIFGISEKASTIEIEDAFKNQFNTWNSRAPNPKYTPYVRAVKDFLLEAKNTLLDPTKRQQYDESLKETSGEEPYGEPAGVPRLEIWDETGTEKRIFEFRNMRMGVPKSFNVTAKNGGGGILNADVKASHPWLTVDTDKIQHSKLPQNLKITVDPSKDKSTNHFGAEGNGYIEIVYKKGVSKESERINVYFCIEIPEIALNRFKSTFIPLTAAIFGFIGSLIKGNNLWGLAYLTTIPFGIWYKMQYIREQGIKRDLEKAKQIAFGILLGWGGLIVVSILKAIFESLSHFSGFLIGASVFGVATYLFSKKGLELSLNKGIDVSKYPPAVMQVASVGIVVLAIIVHSGSKSEVYKPTPPISKPPITTSLKITRSVIAEGLDSSKNPIGIGTNFSVGNKTLYYYVSYTGGIPNKTVFLYRWYQGSNQIGSSQLTLVYESGNAWSSLPYNYGPGTYEVKLYIDGQESNRAIFKVGPSSADIQREEEQRRHEEAERQRREAEQRRQLEEQQRAEEQRRQPTAPAATPRITKAVVAVGLDTNQVPFGVNTSFSSENKRLYYYVSYNGAIADRTVFVYKWYKYTNEYPNLIRQDQFTLKYAAGNAWNYFDYDFQPGRYEAQLYANGERLNRTLFSVSAISGDTRRSEEQQRREEVERRRRQAEERRQFEEQRRAEERQRQRRGVDTPSRPFRSDGWQKSRESVTYEDK